MAGIDNILEGIGAKSKELELVAHNMSNANTGGFKASRMVSQKPLINFVQGEFISTHRPLDVSIAGPGFFEIQTPEGTKYTRNGAFTLNASGVLSTSDGGTVIGTDGPIRVREHGPITIGRQGSLMVNSTEVGQIKLVTFDDLTKLAPAGNTSFVADGAQPTVATDPSLLQGALESSNTNIVREMVKLIEIARQHESYQKILKTKERMDQQLASSIARIS